MPPRKNKTKRNAHTLVYCISDANRATQKGIPHSPCPTRFHFVQVKAYSKPPPLVETVMAAVMTMMGRASDWATAKKALGEGNFLTQIKTFNKDNVSNALMTKVKKYVNNPDFSFENVAKVSTLILGNAINARSL